MIIYSSDRDYNVEADRGIPYAMINLGGVIIELKGDETGYSVVGDYIRRYWESVECFDDVLFTITFEDGSVETNVAEVDISKDGPSIEFVDDWWEGQKRFALNGIRNISEYRVAGGIYLKKGEA